MNTESLYSCSIYSLGRLIPINVTKLSSHWYGGWWPPGPDIWPLHDRDRKRKNPLSKCITDHLDHPLREPTPTLWIDKFRHTCLVLDLRIDECQPLIKEKIRQPSILQEINRLSILTTEDICPTISRACLQFSLYIKEQLRLTHITDPVPQSPCLILLH